MLRGKNVAEAYQELDESMMQSSSGRKSLTYYPNSGGNMYLIGSETSNENKLLAISVSNGSSLVTATVNVDMEKIKNQYGTPIEAGCCYSLDNFSSFDTRRANVLDDISRNSYSFDLILTPATPCDNPIKGNKLALRYIGVLRKNRVRFNE